MSIPGNLFFDCLHARRDSEEVHNDSGNLATHRKSLMTSRILRKGGIENSGSEEQLQLTLLPCFSIRARRKRLDDKYVLCL